MARNHYGFVPMHLAASSGHVLVVETMRQQEGFYQGDLDTCNTDGWSCLHLASREGHLRVVDLLLLASKDKGDCKEGKSVPVDCRTADGRTALMVAVQKVRRRKQGRQSCLLRGREWGRGRRRWQGGC
eukprot:1916515-Rhodomonas_salina.1